MTKVTHTSELNTFGLRVWGGSVDTFFPPHRHNEIEINAIEQGFFTYMLAGREETIHAGQIGIFWGGIPHQVIRFQPATRLFWGTIPLEYVMNWDLPPVFLRDLLSGRMAIDPHPLYHPGFFARWQAELAGEQEAIALMEIRAMFFRLAHTRPAYRMTTYSSRDRAGRMARYMSTHFEEPLTVAQVARQVSLHPGYAMTIFRQAFGLTMIEYLTQQRIAHAQRLLITSDQAIAEIALASGFPTLSRFYQAFQRLCGMPPGQYRLALRRIP